MCQCFHVTTFDFRQRWHSPSLFNETTNEPVHSNITELRICSLDLGREEPEVEIAVVLLVDSEVPSITLHVGPG